MNGRDKLIVAALDLVYTLSELVENTIRSSSVLYTRYPEQRDFHTAWLNLIQRMINLVCSMIDLLVPVTEMILLHE